MKTALLRNSVILFMFLLAVTFSYNKTYAISKTQTVPEGKLLPISVAAKVGNSLYINKVDYHNYLVSSEKKIPIPVKYYYDVKNSLFFLGENNTLYYSDKAAAGIKELLKDIDIVVSDGSDDYLYALNTKGDLYRITVENLQIENIQKGVAVLYSAWKDWVVYKSTEKLWYKQYIDGQIIEIDHKSNRESPYIPETGSDHISNRPKTIDRYEVLSEENIMVGPLCIVKVNYSEFIGRHGGEDRYLYYASYSLEHKDGSSEQHELCTIEIPEPGLDTSLTDNLEILGADENSLYYSRNKHYWDENAQEYKHYIRVFRINYNSYNYQQEKSADDINSGEPLKKDYTECIYEEELGGDKAPSFYWTPSGIYKFSSDKKSLDLIPLDNIEVTHLISSEQQLFNITRLSNNLYFEEVSKDGNIQWVIGLRNGKLSKTVKAEIKTKDIKWQLTKVKRDNLYIKDAKKNGYNLIEYFEGDGIWLYSKGKLNSVYMRGSSLLSSRDSTVTALNNHVTSVEWDKAFSQDGWIYLCIDGKYSRYKADNPSSVQSMNIGINSPVFDSQGVTGFYNSSLVVYTWASKSYKVISKLKQPENAYSQLTIMKDYYVFYNSEDKRIESISKSGKTSKALSGNMTVERDFAFCSGYIYFIDKKSESLYQVRPYGGSLKRVVENCVSVSELNGKLVCILRNGIYSISPSGKTKNLIISKPFDESSGETGMKNLSYIKRIVPLDKRFVIYNVETVPDPGSDMNFFYTNQFYSVTPNFKSVVTLPGTEKFDIVDSYFYYTDTNERVWRIGLDGKGNELVL